MNLLETLAKEFNIPIVGGEHKVWFFRTKAGQFYHDFRVNGYIALGWDLILPEFITETKTSRDSKKEQIEALYPDEKRPGLILGQMETFYTKMNVGDLVVIPAEGGREVSIGKLGELQANIQHKNEAKEYPLCTYMHKRSVEWAKVVDVVHDIYLFKALRAQQTISDVSECGELIFRNLFPVYISEDGIHVTMQKETEANLNLAQNVELQYNFLTIMDEVAGLYGKEKFRADVSIKTAVGSPGFLELILPGIPVSAVAVTFLIKFAIGKEKSEAGSATGILALASKINDLINDYHNRKKTDAETQLLIAQAAKTQAETTLIQAQAAKATAELTEHTEKYEQIAITPSGKTTVEVAEDNENMALINAGEALTASTQISECCNKVCDAASSSGISFDGEKIEKAS